MKRKLKLREEVKDVLAVILLFIIIIGGVIAINNRIGSINVQSSTNERR